LSAGTTTVVNLLPPLLPSEKHPTVVYGRDNDEAAGSLPRLDTYKPLGQFGVLHGACVYLKATDATTTKQISNDQCSEGRGGTMSVSAYTLAKVAPSTPPTSCSMIIVNVPSANSGIYTLAGGNQVYCDFSTNGGGWTMIAYGPNGQFGSLATSTSTDVDLATNKNEEAWVSSLSAELLRSSKEMVVAWTTKTTAKGGIASFEKAVKFAIPTVPKIDIKDTKEIATSDASYLEVLGYASQTGKGSMEGSVIRRGANWGTSTSKTSTFKAMCRCVKEDNSKGISICRSGCGSPNKVCDNTFGCSSGERNCNKNKCTCKPKDINTNTMTFAQCRTQCVRIGMIIPKDKAGIDAARNTGCNANGKTLWVDVLGGGSTKAPTQIDILRKDVTYASNDGGASKFVSFSETKYGGAVFLRGDKDKSTHDMHLKLKKPATVYVAVETANNAPTGFQADAGGTLTYSTEGIETE
jgi:hypothetical protein